MWMKAVSFKPTLIALLWKFTCVDIIQPHINSVTALKVCLDRYLNKTVSEAILMTNHSTVSSYEIGD